MLSISNNYRFKINTHTKKKPCKHNKLLWIYFIGLELFAKSHLNFHTIFFQIFNCVVRSIAKFCLLIKLNSKFEISYRCRCCCCCCCLCETMSFCIIRWYHHKIAALILYNSKKRVYVRESKKVYHEKL